MRFLFRLKTQDSRLKTPLYYYYCTSYSVGSGVGCRVRRYWYHNPEILTATPRYLTILAAGQSQTQSVTESDTVSATVDSLTA